MAILRCLLLIVLTLSFLSVTHSKYRARKHFSHKNNRSLEETKADPQEADRITVIDLPNILVTVGQTFAQISNLHCFIPAHFNLTDVDPDFSNMMLPVNISLGSLELIGDYSIAYFMAPIPYYYGRIYLTMHNVSATGTAPIVLTPGALFAYQLQLTYNLSTVSARVLPFIQNALVAEGEMLLSRAVLEDPVLQTIKKEIIAHLDYLILRQINTALGRMSVFTVGQHNVGERRNHFADESTQKVSLEELVDVLLENVRSQVPDEIDIPNLHRNFSEKLESTLINGTFNAESGWIAGMSTLKRASNVSISKEKRALELTVDIGFDVLEMGYDNFIAKLLKKELSGELRGNFLYRMMSVTLRLDPNEMDTGCKVELIELQSFRTNGYRLETMANFSKDFEWLKRRINIWLIGHFHSTVAKQLQKEISNGIEGLLHQLDCGEYIPHFKRIN